MSGQLTTSETIYVSSAGVIAADSAGMSSVKSYSALLTSIAALPLAGGTLTGNLLFTDNTYTIGAAGATRPSAVHVGSGGVVSAGDISISKSGNAMVTVAQTGVGSPSVVLDGATKSSGVINYLGSGDIRFWVNDVDGTYPLTITTAGRLGVNTASPSHLFHVAGTNATNVRLDSASVTAQLLNSAGSFLVLNQSGTTLFSVAEATGTTTCAGTAKIGVYTVATLPAAGSNAYHEACVSDSNAAASGNYGATVSGGGSNKVRVFSDGTNWVIA